MYPDSNTPVPTAEALPTDQVATRFATPEEIAARKQRAERAFDLLADARVVVKQMGPRDRSPHQSPETVPSASAVLIALAIADLTAAIRDNGVVVPDKK